MLNVRLDETTGIASLSPEGRLATSDFNAASAKIDPYIEQQGKLNGLFIETKAFPGWDSFGALISHLRFVRDHHHEIKRVAIATDSSIGNLAETICKHFVSAEVKTFGFDERDQAKLWLTDQTASS
jgi:hypothetical protein